jgi:hypothetical protein
MPVGPEARLERQYYDVMDPFVTLRASAKRSHGGRGGSPVQIAEHVNLQFPIRRDRNDQRPRQGRWCFGKAATSEAEAHGYLTTDDSYSGSNSQHRLPGQV